MYRVRPLQVDGGRGDHQHGGGAGELPHHLQGVPDQQVRGGDRVHPLQDAGGQGDHQHGGGGQVRDAMGAWNLEKEYRERSQRITKREPGPSGTYLGGDLLGEEKGPTLARWVGRSSSPKETNKIKEENNKSSLSRTLSSSTGRENQEDQDHHRKEAFSKHKEERRQKVNHLCSCSSSFTNSNLCTNRLGRDFTYRGCVAVETRAGSWQPPGTPSTSTTGSPSLTSSSASGVSARKPPNFNFSRGTPITDNLPCCKLADNVFSGKTVLTGGIKTTEPAARYSDNNERESCNLREEQNLDYLST